MTIKIDAGLAARFWPKVAKSEGCWLWTASKHDFGYGVLGIGSRRDRTKRIGYAHRLSWVMANGPVPSDMQVLHRCDVPACVRPDHLFLGTQAHNIDDMWCKGRGVGGKSFKVPDAVVEEIRRLYLEGQRLQKDLATRFNVSRSFVCKAVKGQSLPVPA